MAIHFTIFEASKHLLASITEAWPLRYYDDGARKYSPHQKWRVSRVISGAGTKGAPFVTWYRGQWVREKLPALRTCYPIKKELLARTLVRMSKILLLDRNGTHSSEWPLCFSPCESALRIVECSVKQRSLWDYYDICAFYEFNRGNYMII